MKQANRTRQTRREFLGGVLAGGAATALLASGAMADDPSERDATAASLQHKPEGYRLTPHIRTYYRKAQI